MTAPVLAAGALCWRDDGSRITVLVVHRARHGDVSLPKGKLETGESLPEAAVREVREETGIDVALGVPLGSTRYTLPSGRTKTVAYWAAEVGDKAYASAVFTPGDEVTAVEWLPIDEARAALTWERDRHIVDALSALFDRGVRSTFAVIALRHGKAVDHGDWRGRDRDRPLTARGSSQAQSVAPMIAAWRPRRLVSSTAVRCRQTIEPLAHTEGLEVRLKEEISQDAYGTRRSDVPAVVGKRLKARKTAVLCSHGPVLPDIVGELAHRTGTRPGAELRRSAALETGSFSVFHLSTGDLSAGILAVETHSPSV